MGERKRIKTSPHGQLRPAVVSELGSVPQALTSRGAGHAGSSPHTNIASKGSHGAIPEEPPRRQQTPRIWGFGRSNPKINSDPDVCWRLGGFSLCRCGAPTLTARGDLRIAKAT